MGAVHILPAPGNDRLDPFPPMARPVLVTDLGEAWVAHPFYRGVTTNVPLCEGLAVAWAPCTPLRQIILSIWGGHSENPSDESVTTTLTRPGLKRLIADLQSIADQLDAQP